MKILRALVIFDAWRSYINATAKAANDARTLPGRTGRPSLPS